MAKHDDYDSAHPEDDAVDVRLALTPASQQRALSVRHKVQIPDQTFYSALAG